MLKSEVPSQIDAVDIGEVAINFLQQSVQGFPGMIMSAKYALVISGTGTRLGAGNRTVWSDATHMKLRELIASMESDICIDVFGVAPTGSGGSDDDPHSDGVPEL